MNVQPITLSMPEAIYQRAKHAADLLQKPMEEVIVDTLASTLPLLDDVPAEMASEVAAMAQLSDEALQGLANGTMLVERQALLHQLLEQQGQGALAEPAQRELASLMAEYGRSMLRRAKAVALLLARGRTVPALSSASLEP
jgi:hypothetical protein